MKRATSSSGGRFAAAGLLAVLSLAATACQGGATANTAACSPRPSSGASLLPATPTTLTCLDLAGFQQLMTQLRGTPVAVNIWASWCGPCRVEAPTLATVAREFQGRVQFVGVDIQDQVGNARAFIRQYGWVYPSVFDPGATIRRGLGFLGVPDTVVFDRSGKQVGAISGPLSEPTLRNLLAKAISS